MDETCAVCRKGKGPEKCEVCGFSDNGFINRQFPIPEDAKNWIEMVVKPYRYQWEKADLLAQLEAAKKRETELLTQLEIAKSNAVLHAPPVFNTFTDPRDGKVYRTVKIGNQVWMTENLAYNAVGSKCYGNDESNCQIYGRLYYWDTAMKVCPKGWHLPTKAELDILTTASGGEDTGGKFLKAISGWNDCKGKSGNGTDAYGFSALPGGLGFPIRNFSNIGNNGYWWSTSEDNSHNAYSWIISYNTELIYGGSSKKGFLFSVRCLKD